MKGRVTKTRDGGSTIPKRDETASRLAKVADESTPGVLREYWLFLRYRKRWWLIPILLILLVVGLMASLSPAGVAPFIYAIW